MATHIHIHLPAKTRDAGEFKESDHPRKADGKFGSGGGGGGKAAQAKKASYSGKNPDHIKSVSSAGGKAVAITNAGARHEIPASATGGKMPKPGEPISNYVKQSGNPRAAAAKTSAPSYADKVKYVSAHPKVKELNDAIDNTMEEIESRMKRNIPVGKDLDNDLDRLEADKKELVERVYAEWQAKAKK